MTHLLEANITEARDAQQQKEAQEKLVSRIVRPHIPIMLGHALLFFILCDVFGHLVIHPETNSRAISATTSVAERFVAVYAVLLAANALWLLLLFWRRALENAARDNESRPKAFWRLLELRWATFNIAFAIAAGLLVLLFAGSCISLSLNTFLIVASAIVLVNSALDLAFTAPAYILFPGRPIPRT